MLTEFQKRKLTRYFNFYDVDNNGYIDQDDYALFAEQVAQARGWAQGTTGYEMVMGRFMADWQVLASFSDTDQNQQITLDEWFEYHKYIFLIDAKHRAGANDIISTIFETIDINGDGHITENEFKIFYGIYGLDAALAEKTFKKIDINRDGILTRSEIATLYHQFAHSNDPDAPGNYLFGPL